jgi:AcrR family transcriptional regulator
MGNGSKDDQREEGSGPNPPRVPSERPGPAGGKRDRNRRERTRALLEAALGLFLQEGIEGVSIDSIAREAGLSKGSFYRYFEDKTELVSELVRPLRARLEAAFEACREALEGAGGFSAYYAIGAEVEAMVRERPDVARLYLQETRAPAVGARRPIAELSQLITRHSIELTELAQKQGVLRSITPAVSALAVIGAGERLLQAYFEGELEGGGATVAGELIGLVLTGLNPG